MNPVRNNSQSNAAVRAFLKGLEKLGFVNSVYHIYSVFLKFKSFKMKILVDETRRACLRAKNCSGLKRANCIYIIYVILT